jgi:hypothetical protein
MKTNNAQQTLNGKMQHALNCVKKRFGQIKRAYRGEVYLAWYSTHPFRIVVIEHPVAFEGPLCMVEEPPAYQPRVLENFKPQDVIRCLDNSAKTLHEISQAVSREAPKSRAQEKNGMMSYTEMAARLRQATGDLQEMRASELNELLGELS